MAFYIGFFCSHSVHNVTLRRIQNLNGFSIGFFCSHSAHNVTLRRIQNLNGFSIGFFCSHSAHSMTLRRIQRLPTSVGLAQARPKYPVYRSHSAYNVTPRRIQNFNGFFYRIFLFTLRAQRDAPTHTKLEWLFLSDFFVHTPCTM